MSLQAAAPGKGQQATTDDAPWRSALTQLQALVVEQLQGVRRANATAHEQARPILGRRLAHIRKVGGEMFSPSVHARGWIGVDKEPVDRVSCNDVSPARL